MDVLKSVWAKQASGRKPYFCVSTKRIGDDAWKDHFFKWPDTESLDKILKTYSTEKFNLYFCPLPFERPHRRKEYVMGSNLLWADIDEAKPEDMTVPPHVLWESSPGRWAGLWLMERWLAVEELEDLNRRMTYGTGSDKAGWDLTQVLRIPGTRNHKYKGSPLGRMVRMKWGVKLKVNDVPKNVSGARGGRALEIYKKWESKLRGETRSILTAKVASAGKRSDVLWKLYHQLFDAGMTVDEVRLVVKESVWNKYRGRKDEDKQIARDIEKCLGEKLDARSGEIGEGAALAGRHDNFEGVSMDKVKAEEVDWIWWPYLSRGSLTIVEGDPGVGKSYFMQMVAAAICDGSKLPGEGGLRGFEKIKQGNVYYFSVEDDPATVIKPRLEWNDCENQHRFRVYPRKLEMDEEGLSKAEYLVEKYKTDLVVFDTLNYFIGNIDAHRANEVSQKMEHFTRLASKHNCAVVVIRHLTKNSTGNVKATYRGQGSIAFTGTAREVLTVGIHPDEPGLNIVAVTKLNLAKMPKAIGYRIEGGSKRDAKSEFVWENELYELTSDQILSAPPAGGRPADVSADAEKLLHDILKDGRVESTRVHNQLEGRGVSLRTITRVKKKMGIRSIKTPSGWFYELPGQ